MTTDTKKKNNEIIANTEKQISDIDENVKTEMTNPTDPITSESEVEQLLKETRTQRGMSIENARIERFAKPITHAFIRRTTQERRWDYE